MSQQEVSGEYTVGSILKLLDPKGRPAHIQERIRFFQSPAFPTTLSCEIERRFGFDEVGETGSSPYYRVISPVEQRRLKKNMDDFLLIQPQNPER